MALGEGVELRLVWEVKQDVGELHVTMDDFVLMNVFNTLHQLSHDKPSLVLTQVPPLFEKRCEVKAVCILLNHVDLTGRLDRLVLPNREFAVHQSVDLYLLKYRFYIVIGEVLNVENLAGVHFFRKIDSRSNDLQSVLIFALPE